VGCGKEASTMSQISRCCTHQTPKYMQKSAAFSRLYCIFVIKISYCYLETR